jgi:hypothetical protein
MIRVVLVLALLTVAAPAAASVLFIAPQTVTADADGNFAYTATLISNQECLGWAGFGMWGVDNVELGMWVDTFCMDPQPIAPNTPINVEVAGQLTDPATPGVVAAESSFCTCGGGSQETIVLPAPVDNDDESWSTLKAKYR